MAISIQTDWTLLHILTLVNTSVSFSGCSIDARKARSLPSFTKCQRRSKGATTATAPRASSVENEINKYSLSGTRIYACICNAQQLAVLETVLGGIFSLVEVSSRVSGWWPVHGGFLRWDFVEKQSAFLLFLPWMMFHSSLLMSELQGVCFTLTVPHPKWWNISVCMFVYFQS